MSIFNNKKIFNLVLIPVILMISGCVTTEPVEYNRAIAQNLPRDVALSYVRSLNFYDHRECSFNATSMSADRSNYLKYSRFRLVRYIRSQSRISIETNSGGAIWSCVLNVHENEQVKAATALKSLGVSVRSEQRPGMMMGPNFGNYN